MWATDSAGQIVSLQNKITEKAKCRNIQAFKSGLSKSDTTPKEVLEFIKSAGDIQELIEDELEELYARQDVVEHMISDLLEVIESKTVKKVTFRDPMEIAERARLSQYKKKRSIKMQHKQIGDELEQVMELIYPTNIEDL